MSDRKSPTCTTGEPDTVRWGRERTQHEEGTTAGLLDGKGLLVTGVLTEASIAFAAARVAQEEGVETVLSSFGRALSITSRIAARLSEPAPVVDLDRTAADLVAAGRCARWR